MNLHMQSKVFSLHGRMDVLDEAENAVYTIESKPISLHNKTYVRNAAGDEVAYISRKAISLHETHYVEMSDGLNFELRTELFHITKDIIDIEGLGWKLQGDFFQHDYQILDENDRPLAATHVKWFSIHNVYFIDIFDDAKADVIIALYVALERIIQDRAANASASSAANSSASSAPNS